MSLFILCVSEGLFTGRAEASAAYAVHVPGVGEHVVSLVDRARYRGSVGLRVQRQVAATDIARYVGWSVQ